MGKSAPLAIYCVDADNDSKEQHEAILNDLGVLRAGGNSSARQFSSLRTEPAGSWHLQKLAVRLLE